MKRMLCLLLSLFISQNAMCADIATTRSNLEKLESQGIKNSTNPQIKELYEKLSKSVADMAELEKGYIDELQKNADAMHEKENSTANKLIGAAGIGATGIGAMQLMSGMAEKSADEGAENQMKAYMATFRCNYGGLSHKGGEVGIELPAGDLSALKQEYLTLAADLKARKESLDMQPGIESEEILDSATAGLYDDEHVGKTDGQYTSIYKALTDEASEDATEFAEQKEDAKKKVKTGGITAAVGAVGSAAASLIVNKDAPKENSKKIKSEHEQKKRELEKEISNTEEQLNTAIADNEAKIKKI